MFETSIVASGSAYGLDVGEIVMTPKDNELYRYLGVRDGLPESGGILGGNSGVEVLVFETGVPVLADLKNSNYSFLLMGSVSSSTNEDYHILDCGVEELKKLGNVSGQLWTYLRTLDRCALENTVLKPKEGTPFNLWEALDEHVSRKKVSLSR